MVKNCAFSHKTNYFEFFLEILNLEEHQKRCIGSNFPINIIQTSLNYWLYPVLSSIASGAVSTIYLCILCLALQCLICSSKQYFFTQCPAPSTCIWLNQTMLLALYSVALPAAQYPPYLYPVSCTVLPNNAF